MFSPSQEQDEPLEDGWMGMIPSYLGITGVLFPAAGDTGGYCISSWQDLALGHDCTTSLVLLVPQEIAQTWGMDAKTCLC